MPFYLVNTSYLLSTFMAKLANGLEKYCLSYLDDMAIFLNNLEGRIKHLEAVLVKIRESKLKVKIEKCKFAQKNELYT